MHDVPPPPSSNGKKPPSPAQPYLDWALATRFSYLREGAWIPLLIEFDAKEAQQRSQSNEKLTALQAFATRRWLADEPRTLDDQLIIPELFANPPERLKNAPHFNFCVALIRRKPDVVMSLTNLDGWKRTVLRVELGPPIDLADKQSSPVTPDSASEPPTPSAPPSRTAPASKQGVRQSILAKLRRLIPFGGSRFFAEAVLPTSASASMPASPDSSAAADSPTATVQPVGQSLAADRTGLAAQERIERVVIAVIDQGIAFANSRFLSGSEPRIEYLWQQNVLVTSMPVAGVAMPFTPGFELNKDKIRDAVAKARSTGAGDEWVYREYGGLSFAVDGYKPLARRRAHGTHVLDLAAGGTDPSRHPIIAVDMPEDAVGDPAGSTLSVQAAWALIYILDRAEKLRRKPDEKLPVVVNLSYGPHEGPHDGTGVLERFMDELWKLASVSTSKTPLELVLAAGNFRQTRTHAAFDLDAATDKHLQWRLQPGSLSPSLMEIWLPQGAGPEVTVTLTPPAASASLTPVTVSANDPDKPFIANANVLYQAKYVAASGGVKADSIVLSIARTAPDPAGSWSDAVAPSGLWRVTLNARAATRGVKAWIRRSDTLSGRRSKGRQSYFDDPAFARFASNGRPHDFDPDASKSYVKRYQTLSGIATGEHTRVIGGYRQSDCFPAPYSSHGTHLKSAVEVGPDWLEYSDDSDALPGVHAAGTASGSVTAMNGSSVAAPQATRWIADHWVTTGKAPVARPGLLPIALYPDRPIPTVELPFAAGDGRTRFKPRWPPRR